MNEWHHHARARARAFWAQLHGTYWRLYIIIGALVVPAGAYLMRERRENNA